MYYIPQKKKHANRKKANIPQLSKRKQYKLDTGKITLRRGTANHEFVVPDEGRTFFVYRDGVPQGKKVALTAGGLTSPHPLKDGTVFVLNPGDKIELPEQGELYADEIKLLKVTVTGGNEKIPEVSE